MNRLALLICAVAACQPATEVVVGFATDLHAPGALDNVLLHVSRVSDGLPEGGDGLNWDVTGVLDVPVNLPASYGLYSDDKDVQLNVTLSATQGGVMVVSQRVVLSLVSGQTLFYRMGLTGACQTNLGCMPAETCIEGVCRPAEVDSTQLPDYDSELVTHLSCVSAINYIDTGTGLPMPLTADASSCPAALCVQGVCLKPPSTSGGGSGGGPMVYFKASNSDQGDLFGGGVVVSADGNTLAVSAPREDSNAKGVGGNPNDNSAVDSGAVYIYTRSGGLWTQQAYLKASNTHMNDLFGSTLALSSDGNTLAVGAYNENSNATGIDGNQTNNADLSSGAVYVFTRSGKTWSQEAYVKASNTDPFDEFGFSVALAADGNTLAVGARSEASNATAIDGVMANNSAIDAGAVYVFTRAGTTWSQQAYVKASNTGPSDQFGFAVALSGDGNTLAVGAPNEASNATQIDGDQLNNANAGAGAVYVFTRAGVTWSQQAYVKAFVAADAGDSFGSAVALSGDGNRLAIGAPNEASVSSNTNGLETDNSAPMAGAVFLYTRAGTTWSQMTYIKPSNTASGAIFGSALAMSADGSTLAVGSVNESNAATGINGNEMGGALMHSGAVYIFGGGGQFQSEYVKAPNSGVDDNFGVAVSVSADGSVLAVGARNEAGGAQGFNGDQADDTKPFSGAAYIYQ